jgi:hypothetical protein
MKIIPYGGQYIYCQDIRPVSKVLKKDLIKTGDYIKNFYIKYFKKINNLKKKKWN